MTALIDTLQRAALEAHRAGYPHTCPGTARERELISQGKALGWDEAISAAKMTGGKDEQEG